MNRRQARVALLRRGTWQATNGTLVPLAQMPGPHLVNAYLRALLNDEQDLAQPLAAEVVRRGLQEAAWQEAARRTA